MRLDAEGWLAAEDGGARILRFPTVRTYRLGVPAPLGIVWHWTGDRGGPGFGETLARRAQTYKQGIDRAASWHLLIAKDGTVYQSAPVTVGTWHVGRPGTIAGQHFENINRATVGCEIENAGRLRKIGDRFYCWPYWTNPGAPASELRPDPKCLLDDSRAVVVPGQGSFDAFPSAQVDSARELLRSLVARHGWSRGASAYGHRDFDSPRKEDPGPLWADVVLPQVLDPIFGGRQPAAAGSPASQPTQGG